ncbi:Uncharacterized protein conserved in bacteria [Providencia alcalifaciens]|nr:Uncharacterized protein conserved in bacteria [Providencia alcalifaciens]
MSICSLEDVFTGRDQGESLQALLGSFDKTFKMVTIQGALMNAQQASELFSKNRGVRPSLAIEIRNIQPLFECDGNTYWIQYLEHQTLAGKENSRTSTVCIKIEGWEISLAVSARNANISGLIGKYVF